jgi:hypothetical protein
LRVSTADQERTGVSLGVQRSSCRQYVSLLGLEVAGEYLDVMGGDRDERPQYQAMLADARRLYAGGEVAMLVVASLDRLGRHLLEAVRCRQEMKNLGVPLQSVREGGSYPTWWQTSLLRWRKTSSAEGENGCGPRAANSPQMVGKPWCLPLWLPHADGHT